LDGKEVPSDSSYRKINIRARALESQTVTNVKIIVYALVLWFVGF